MITGGFGVQFDLKTGLSRSWFIDREGVKRWADNNKPALLSRLSGAPGRVGDNQPGVIASEMGAPGNGFGQV